MTLRMYFRGIYAAILVYAFIDTPQGSVYRLFVIQETENLGTSLVFLSIVRYSHVPIPAA